MNNTYGTHGTLTRADIDILTPAEVKALYQNASTSKWREMTAMLKTQFEMKACGIRRLGFPDYLMSSMKSGKSALVNLKKMDRGETLIAPFIMGRQSSIVNSQFWTISDGWAFNDQAYPGTTLHGGVPGDRIIRVASYNWGDNPMQVDKGWFLTQTRIFILNVVNGAAAHGQWKVIDAENPALDTSDYVDVLIRPEGPDTTTVDLTPGAAGHPGIVLIGINNVNDYESWCSNPANVNGIKHVPFWYQTRRRTRRVDSFYKEMLAHFLNDNAYFEAFYDLPLSERNRQDEEQWMVQFAHAFLFGRAISANQTLDLWENLDSILTDYTPSGVAIGADLDNIQALLGGKMVAKRANMIGIYEQLKACNQVKDLQNQPLNIVEWLDQLEVIRRVRKTQNRPITSIDVYCDRETAELVEVGMINYTRNKYGDIIQLNITPGSNEWGFEWKTFKMPMVNFSINMINTETFDDIHAAFASQGAAMAARGRFLLALDVGAGGSIYPAMLGSNRKVYQIGQLEKLAAVDSSFACIMEHPTFEQTLTSETVTAIVDCPRASLWIEGIADTTPIYTGREYPYTDLYGGSNV